MSDNFMEPQITDKMYWLEVNGSWCNEYIPEYIFDCEITQLKECIKNCEWEKLHDLIKDYTENTEIWEAWKKELFQNSRWVALAQRI